MSAPGDPSRPPAAPPTRSWWELATGHTRSRLAAVRRSARIIAQATLAAMLAFWVARLLGHDNPFFAPIAAVATVAISLAQRLRRASELVLGNAIGILLADRLIATIGTGAWQLGLVVALALCGAILAGGGPTLTMQAGSSAILIATLTPPTPEAPFNYERFIDALVGGGVGLAISAVVMPPDPARTAQRSVAPILAALREGYLAVCDAVRTRDGERAERALTQLRGTAPALAAFQAGLAATRESVRLAPWYWRQGGIVSSYAIAGFHLDNTLRNLRVLARHVRIALDRGEEIPAGLPEALGTLAEVVAGLGPVLAGEAEPDLVRAQLLDVLDWTAEDAHGAGSSPFIAPVRAQVRISISDLLQATGLAADDAIAFVRAAG